MHPVHIAHTYHMYVCVSVRMVWDTCRYTCDHRYRALLLEYVGLITHVCLCVYSKPECTLYKNFCTFIVMYMCMYMYTYMCLLDNCCDIIHHCRLWSREREEEETKTERRGGSRKQERKEFKTASRVLGV